MNQSNVFNTINGKDVDCSPPRPAVPFSRTQLNSADPGNVRLRNGVEEAGETAYRTILALGGEDAANAAKLAASCAYASSCVTTRSIVHIDHGEYGGGRSLPPSRFLERAIGETFACFRDDNESPETFAYAADRAGVFFGGDVLATDRLDLVAAAVAAGLAGALASKRATTTKATRTTAPSTGG